MDRANASTLVDLQKDLDRARANNDADFERATLENMSRVQVSDAIRADPQGYLDGAGTDGVSPPAPDAQPETGDGPASAEPDGPLTPMDKWEASEDRKLAEDIIAHRAQQDILRQQGNEQGAQEMEDFISKLPTTDAIKADPQGYLDSLGHDEVSPPTPPESDTPPAADPVDGPVVEDATAPSAPQEVGEPVGAGTWDEVPPGQGASPALSQETADTPAATVAPIPEASPDSLRPDSPTATDPLQLPDGSAEQPQSVTKTATIEGDAPDTRPDERMFSDEHVHQALSREKDNLNGDELQPQADKLTGLPPDASIVEGGYVYGTDSLGRVTQAYAANLELEPGIRTRSELTLARGLGEEGDDAGHLIAARFGGSDSVWNLAPQDSNLNRGVWNRMETVWSDAIKMENEVSINVMANYVDKETRPASYTVQTWINGELHSTLSFQNRRRGD